MKKIILLTLLMGITFSCNDFEGWNVDVKNPSDVPPAFLLTAATQDLFNEIVGMNVNSTNQAMTVQYWGQTTYQDEANYLWRERDVGGSFWQTFYRDVLKDLQEAARLVATKSQESADVQKNQQAMLELISIYAWHVMVDTFGNIPYSEALNGNANLVPVYEDDEAIYLDLFNRLDTALNSLDTGSSMGNMADGDLVYNGDVEMWKMFGNSLKLRMAVRISDANSALATAKAGEAILGGVISSNDYNAAYPYESTPPNTNPNWVTLVQSGRSDYIMVEQFVNMIVPLNDPRTPVYMDDNLAPDPYKGSVYGVNSTYGLHTHLGEAWHTATQEGIIIDYAEVNFLIAEAIERGLISGDAAMYYNLGITSSIVYWGGSVVDAATYIAQPTVAYATAGATWQEVIGNQKYLALFGRGVEAWATWRMLDYPNTFTRPPDNAIPVPRRYYYPNNEPQLNGANYDAGSAAMGGDELESKIFWDINGQGN